MSWQQDQSIMTDPIRSSTQSQSYQAHDATEAAISKPNLGPNPCTEEMAELGRAGVAVAGSVAALVAATPTVVGVLPGIAAFIGASTYTGQALAEYLNCRDAAASKGK